MDRGLIAKMICPPCKVKLSYQNASLYCDKCGQVYTFVNGMPNFLPDNLMEKYNSELKLQDLNKEMDFYQNMYQNLKGIDDGHCVVYGYDEIYDFMSGVPRGSLLDVGCGAGHHSKDLSSMGYDVTGIDISVNGLNQAQCVSKAHNQNIDFVIGDVENLPFDDNAFDVVFCSLILHHFPKRDKLLKEISRVSKSHFVTFEVNSFHPISFIRFDIINPTIGISSISKNQRTVSPDKLTSELCELGFKDISVKYVDIHNYTGRDPNSLKAKLLNLYGMFSKLLPYKCRFNLFIMKAAK